MADNNNMATYGPNGDMTYIEWQRWKAAGSMKRTWNTADQVSDGRRDDGVRFQRRVDQLGHETREHADGRRDVTINLRS